MASAKAIALMESIYSRVDTQVRAILATLPGVTVAAQDDGAVVTNNHRILNFMGTGVVVADDPSMNRTNVIINGTGLTATATQLLLSATTARRLSLWNGSSNNAPTANWETLAFNDSGWSFAVAPSGGAATTISGAARIWSATTPAHQLERTLFRQSFTAPAGTYASATLTIEADNYITAIYLNGVSLGSVTNGIPGTSQSKATISITPSVIVAGGTNVLAVEGENGDPTSIGSAWVAYAIDSVVVTSSASTTTVTGALGSNVTMTNANQYYDGPSVSLAAGTWLVAGTITIQPSGGTHTAQIWDGASAHAVSTSKTAVSGEAYITMSLSAIVTLASTTTIKISDASTTGGSIIRAAAPNNAVGNNASTMLAVQL